MSTSARSFEPGELVAGRYRITSPLDAGGMGEVFVAYDEQLERKVALKAMGKALRHDAGFRERFRREATATARVAHAGVVQVFERGEHAGVPFMVTELLDGHSLSHRIKAAGKLSPGFAARIGGDIADAMHAAHAAGVIHRDLKPANVFVADMGQPRETVKVLDFGVAKLLDASQLTRSADYVGTPAYTAPEQLLDTRKVGPGSDVWSIACIVYEMVTGKAPFEASSHQELVARILHDESVPATELVADLPEALARVLQRALRKDPAQRFASAANLSRALYAIASEHGESVPVAITPSGRPTANANASRVPQAPIPPAARTPALGTDDGETLAPRASLEPTGGEPLPRGVATRAPRLWLFAGLVLVLVLVLAWMF